ncbi:MAG: hypothetical protein QHH10_11170 [Peptococcaceae bacterium]|jgi:hypothetical protein|nr:hypothetical protein [Peptococcaceae bacterium]MDH7525860.1 hypothetical protein [Peptococcaceae bacterium]
MENIKNIVYPEEFRSGYIKEHWDYKKDLEDILEKSGLINSFSGVYKQRLKWLEENKEDSIKRNKWFEKLKRAPDLYSMKFERTAKNIRILYAFVSYGKEIKAVLLYPFEEKEDTKRGQKSYSCAIEIAQRRLKEVKG